MKLDHYFFHVNKMRQTFNTLLSKSREDQKKGHRNEFCPQNQEKTKKKTSSLKFSPVFGPKLGEDQKKEIGLHSSLVRFLARKNIFTRFCPLVCSYFLPNLQKVGGGGGGGGACRNFAYYSMLIILSWRPKGGALHHAPLNKPLYIHSTPFYTVQSTYFHDINNQATVNIFF